LDIGVLGYIGIVQHKEHSPEVLSIPPGTPCINNGPFCDAFTRCAGATAACPSRRNDDFFPRSACCCILLQLMLACVMGPEMIITS